LESPLERNSSHFDPGSKFHVANGFQYIPYFVAHILQFQMHESLCKAAGELDGDKPLFQCDLTGSKKAGHQLSRMLKMGRREPWPQVLQGLTGSHKKMDASSLLHYYQPLYLWLREQNEKLNVTVGWNEDSEDDSRNTCDTAG